MGQVRKTARAEIDLVDILAYIHQRNPTAAQRLNLRFSAVFELLAEHPWAGVEREHYAPGLRSFVSGNYAILYRIGGEEDVQVIRVLHGARDIEAILAHGDDSDR